jgi:spermidine synthase
MTEPALPTAGPARARLMLFSVLVVATCGLVYELIAATMASYLLGDSVTQFSLVIGVYLTAMGLGSWLSKSLTTRLPLRFVQVQLVIAVVGGCAAPLLFVAYPWIAAVRPLLFGLLVVVGTMVGLEIPLLIRILEGGTSLRELVARVLAFDYLGALAASVLFPLVLLPELGLVRSSLLFGAFNAAVALWCIVAFRQELGPAVGLRLQGMVILVGLLGGVVLGQRIERFGEAQLFEAPVLLSVRTPYQRLTLTRARDDTRLFIDGNLQFSSLDEHRYHEALVHPALATAASSRRVLVLGGGDGLALREILAHPGVERVDLVDLDPQMVAIFAEHPVLTSLNQGSFADPRVHVHAADAMTWLEERRGDPSATWDVIVVDLPDPNNFSLGKLYTRSFYGLLGEHLAADGAAVVQATSPYLAPRSYWCIVRTLGEAGWAALPYHAYVPSFGDWGFVLATRAARPVPERLVPGVPRRFLSDALLPALFVFPADQPRLDVESNRLSDQLLVHYYEEDLRESHGLPRG